MKTAKTDKTPRTRRGKDHEPEPTHIVSRGDGTYYCKLAREGVERAKATWLSEDEAEGQAEFLRRMGYPDSAAEPIKDAAVKSSTTPRKESVVPQNGVIVRRRGDKDAAAQGAPASVSAQTLASSVATEPVATGRPAPVSGELPVARRTVSEVPEKFVLRFPSGSYFSSRVEFVGVMRAEAEKLSAAGAKRVADELKNLGWIAVIEPA